MKRKSKKKVLILINLLLIFGLIGCKDTIDPYYPPVAPDGTTIKSVVTHAPVNVTTTTADLGGSATFSGSADVLERGVYITDSYDLLTPKSAEGLLASGKKFVGQITDGDNFTVSLSGLKANTRYLYTAFTTTKGGTVYGDIKNLVTSYGTVMDAEGNEYQTVKIGDQEWMRENLQSTLYLDKSRINGTYNRDDDYMFGKHYTWKAANNSQGAKSGKIAGACPTGWHVPTDAEFQTLLKYVGVPANQISLGFFGENQACQLKDGWHEYWSNTSIENSTGFSVLPSGICNPDAGDECICTGFWTSTPYIYYGFQRESEKIFRADDEPDCACGISIRCIRD